MITRTHLKYFWAVLRRNHLAQATHKEKLLMDALTTAMNALQVAANAYIAASGSSASQLEALQHSVDANVATANTVTAALIAATPA
jgi:hypothetical protein